MNYHPITVVGGGIVGKLAAFSLGKLLTEYYKTPVLLIGKKGDSHVPTVATQPYSDRVSFLTLGAIQFFRKVGLWEKISSKNPFPVSTMKIFNGELPAYLHPFFDGSFLSICSENAQDYPILGYIIKNLHIEWALDEEIMSSPFISVAHDDSVISSICPPTNNNKISFQLNPATSIMVQPQLDHVNSSTHYTSLLLGCDGSASFVRTSLSPSHFIHRSEDYGANGIVATFSTDKMNTMGTAYQRYLPSGPIAALPLSPNSYSLVWSIPRKWSSHPLLLGKKEELPKILMMAFYSPYLELCSFFNNKDSNLPHFMKLTSEIGVLSDFGAIVECSIPLQFPLKSGIVSSSISISSKNLPVILLGDAAHSVHPHAGQGLNMGIMDISSLHDIIKKNARLGIDLGSYDEILLPYAQARDKQNIAMTQLIDVILKGYMIPQNSIAGMLRSRLVSIINTCTPLKKLIVSTAVN